MFIGVLWLRRKRTKPSNTVGVDGLVVTRSRHGSDCHRQSFTTVSPLRYPGDPKTTKFDFVHGYVQTRITKGFHQFCNCEFSRFGSPRTSTPTWFVPRHFVSANRLINQNLKSNITDPRHPIRSFTTSAAMARPAAAGAKIALAGEILPSVCPSGGAGVMGGSSE